jgi:hypothetical protein
MAAPSDADSSEEFPDILVNDVLDEELPVALCFAVPVLWPPAAAGDAVVEVVDGVDADGDAVAGVDAEEEETVEGFDGAGACEGCAGGEGNACDVGGVGGGSGGAAASIRAENGVSGAPP